MSPLHSTACSTSTLTLALRLIDCALASESSSVQTFLHLTRHCADAQTFVGDSHVFRFNNPVEVRKQRDRVKSSLKIVSNANGTGTDSETPTRPPSPGASHSSGPDFDWTFAQREAALARLHGLDPGLDSLPDEDLNKLFDRITKLKSSSLCVFR